MPHKQVVENQNADISSEAANRQKMIQLLAKLLARRWWRKHSAAASPKVRASKIGDGHDNIPQPANEFTV